MPATAAVFEKNPEEDAPEAALPVSVDEGRLLSAVEVLESVSGSFTDMTPARGVAAVVEVALARGADEVVRDGVVAVGMTTAEDGSDEGKDEGWSEDVGTSTGADEDVIFCSRSEDVGAALVGGGAAVELGDGGGGAGAGDEVGAD